MPNGFGFSAFPQRPSPDPQQVGMALAQARFRAPAPASPAAPAAAPMSFSAPSSPDRLHQMFRTLSAQGGFETSGGGQTGTGSAPAGDPDYETADDDEAHSAMHASIGAAATRLGNGVMRNSQVGDAQRQRRKNTLLRLGMAPFEADLLSRSGGI